MTPIVAAVRDWFVTGVAGWTRFWFTPADPATLGVVRIFAGLMLLYTHAVWSLDLEAFFGSHSWVSPNAAHAFYAPPPNIPSPIEDVTSFPDPYGQRTFVWSWFYLADTPAALWAMHIAALIVFALLTLGLFTRVVSVLAYLAALAYVHRTPGALFGLDQINVMLAMYLMIGPSGAAYSLDAWWRRRRSNVQPAAPSVMANVAVRLIQIHMCVIYLFAGIGKAMGPSWSVGLGLWGGIANYEYQSIDATWLAHWPLFSAFVTHLTVYWEIFYCALIWPRWTRPVILAIAIPLHLGIALFMGMITFGLVMLIANLAFIPPEFIRRLFNSTRPAP